MKLIKLIKLTGRATWLDRQYDIVEALNNDPALIGEVVYYMALGERMPQLVLTVCEQLGWPAPAPLNLIADQMYASQRIAYALSKGMFDYFKELCIIYDAPTTLKAIENEHLTEDTLEPLYMAMTEMQGDMRSLAKAMHGMGIETHNGTYKIFSNNPFTEEA
jgi:hypothetical protein